MIARAILVCLALLAISTGRPVDAQQPASPQPIREGGPRPYFTDVAPRSQFAYVTRNDYRSRKYFIQPLAGGVAILDYDNDGKMDIFFTNGAELPSMKKPAAFANALLRNRGEGVFEDRTSTAGLAGGDSGYHIGAAAGDYDNDGDTDLFLANAGAGGQAESVGIVVTGRHCRYGPINRCAEDSRIGRVGATVDPADRTVLGPRDGCRVAIRVAGRRSRVSPASSAFPISTTGFRKD